MEKNVVVFGAGRFGTALAEELFQQDVEVMIIDQNFEKIQEIANHVTTAIQCDLADENAVKELGLSNFDIGVIAIGSDLESSIISTMVAKDAGIPRVIAKASTMMQARILEKLGADQIIFPEIDMGERLARSITGKNIIEYIRLSDRYSMLELNVHSNWVGKTLQEMDFRNVHHVNVVAIKRNEEMILENVGSTKLQKDDLLISIGTVQSIESIQK